MKQDSTKKSMRWLPLVIGLVVLLAAVGVVLAMVLGNNSQPQEQVQEDIILYWNVDRDTYTENSETGLSTREPAEDGLYHLRMVSEGKLLDLTTADKKLVNIIDTMAVCILQVEGNEVINVADPIDAGYTMNKGIYIQKVSGTTITANSSIAMNGMPTRIKVSDELQILDCREKETTLGEPMTAEDLLVMDYVTVCFNEEGDATHVFLAGRTPRSSLYWRAEQFYSSSKKETTRTPDENGVYLVDFFCDGERVTLPCKDKDVVTSIDKLGRLSAHTCLVFDEDGFITGTKTANLGLKALTGCDGYTVTSVDGDTFTAQAMTGKNAGNEFTGTLSQDCKIYDVSKTAASEARQGKAVENVQVGDRVTVWTDTDNNPTLIYVSIRLTEHPVYMSMARKYTTVDGKVQTSRKPDAQGWYTIEMVKVGESVVRTFKTKDINVVNTIDVPTNRIAALALDGNVILRAYESECIYGYAPLGPRYVTGFVSGVYSAINYKSPDSVVNGVVGPNVKVYDFSGTGKLGAETTLREGDLIFVHRNSAEEALEIFVTKRAMGEDHLYWNLGRKYDSTKAETKRVPDEEGYYVFNVAHKGKQTTVKTRSKDMATAMDAMSPGAMGLVVKNGVVQYAFDPIQTSGAVRVAFYSTVTAIDKDGTVHAVTTTGIESSFKPAADCKYYNTSAAYYSHKGEYTDGIKVNDLITGYLDMYGEAKFVYIYGRDVEEMYYHVQRMYDSKTKETSRVPNAEGWYVFQLIVDGKVQELKTKDKAVATLVDQQTGAFGLLTKGDVIYSVTGADRVKDVNKVECTNWSVIGVNGTKITLQYQIPGSKDYTGKTMEVQLHKWHRAFDVSPTAAVFGGQVKLQVGDRVQMFSADQGGILYTYVLSHNTRAAGETSYCEHCKTEVHWEPWTGAAFTAGGHYYVNGNLENTSVLAIGDSKSDYTVVLDLNGKFIKTTGARAFSIGLKEHLVVVDSVGTGIIAATGATEMKKDSDYAGGVINLYDGGKFTMYAGTLKHLGENSKLTQGGTVYMAANCQFTMYGGTITGGTVTGNKGIGGNIYSKGGKIELLGGTVVGGSSEHVAGNVYTLGAMTLKNVTISGGKSTNMGGNIYTEGALTMENANVVGGTSKNGGNIYTKGKITFTNSKITGGTADAGADLLHSGATDVKLSGGQINNMTVVNQKTKVEVAGKLLVYRMDLSSGAKITVGDLNKESQIFVKASGVFTEPNEKMADYQKCFGKAKDVPENDKVVLEGNELKITHVRPNAPLCAHCGQEVQWQVWTGSGATAGHYYMTEDFTATSSPEIKAKDGVILDLNGKNYEVTKARAFFINGGYLVLMDSAGTGTVKGNNLIGVGRGSIANVIGGKLDIYGGTMIPYATILGGTAFYVSTSADGATRSEFNMYGGVIDCSGLTGVTGESSAIHVKGSDVLLAGGEIKAESSIYFGNTAVNLTVSGAPVIEMLKLDGQQIELGELTEGADITVDATGVFTKENDKAADYVEFFHPADEEAKIKADGGKLAVVYGRANAPKCPHCNEDVEWLEWTGGTPAAGHYYLTEDYTTAGASAEIKAKDGVILDLNGKAYVSTAKRAFYINGGYLAIVDTVGTGTVKGHNALDAGKGSIANVIGGRFELYGGTMIPTNATKNGSAFYVAANGNVASAFVVKGGAIDGSALTEKKEYSGLIYAKNSAVTIEGGTFTACAADQGGCLYLAESVNATISGGTFNGQVYVATDKTVTVSGAPVFSELALAEGRKITLGELTEGAALVVSASGEFTVANEKAKDYVAAQYIKAAAAGVVITEKDGVLSINVKTCPHCNVPMEQITWTELTATSGTLAAGHYYLAAPMTLTGEITVGGDVALDLRGQTLSYTGRCFKVSAGNLSVMDTAEGGTIQGAGTSWGGAIYIAAGKTLNLYSGTITAGSDTTQGGVIHVAGTMNMYDGIVTGTGTSTTTLGGAIYVTGTFQMNNGTINGASAKSGGAIYAKGATVTLAGGTINGGTATVGGGVAYLHQCTTTISGGTYGGGTAKSGGNFFVEGGSINVSGGAFNGGTVTNTAANIYILRYSDNNIPCNATITGGVFTCGTVGGNTTNKSGVEVGYTCTLAISGAPQIQALYLNTGVKMNVGAMTENAKVYVASADAVISAANTNMQSYVDSQFFQALEATKKLTVTDGVLSLVNA